MTDVRHVANSEVTRDWRKAYALRLSVTDFLVLVWVVFGVQIAWLGFDSEAIGVSGSRGNIVISYLTISVVIIICWLIALSFYDTRAERVVGVGTAEYRLIANASTRLFGLVAIVAFVFKVDLARGYILMAFPLGILILLLSRWMWRQWLGVKRAAGGFSSNVILVGSEASVAQVGLQLARQPGAGYRVVGACIPFGSGGVINGSTIPILGSIDVVSRALADTNADTLVITSSDDLPPDRLRELSWSLEPGRQHLVVAPGLTGVGGPRIHTRPVSGLPLIHVETPRYEGRKMVAKRILDIIGASILLLLLSPLLLLIAALVRTTSPGPVFFRQIRIGIAGTPFGMLKFRSMVLDAEDQLGALSGETENGSNHVLFKMKNDPRVTSVGRWLRRFSLDELPQLLNVVGGSMSLVGPRPPLEAEVQKYEAHVHRRFLVKPGITGLWQVSGRSTLSWEDSVRLDLYYVENWSITGDLVILWRTLRAVVGQHGAY